MKKSSFKTLKDIDCQGGPSGNWWLPFLKSATARSSAAWAEEAGPTSRVHRIGVLPWLAPLSIARFHFWHFSRTYFPSLPSLIFTTSFSNVCYHIALNLLKGAVFVECALGRKCFPSVCWFHMNKIHLPVVDFNCWMSLLTLEFLFYCKILIWIDLFISPESLPYFWPQLHLTFYSARPHI